MARGVLRFALQRAVFSIVVVFVVLFVVFLLIHLAPGRPELALTPGSALTVTPETLDAIRDRYGLGRPILEQFGLFLANALTLDFGNSLRTNESVISVLGSGLAVTLPLILIGFVFSTVLGILGGVVAATRRGTAVDRAVSNVTMFGTSAPPFVSGIVLLYVFGVLLGLFPVFGEGTGLLDRLYHLVLPGITLGLLTGAGVVKVTRAAMIDALGGDYVTFARARGMSPAYVLRTALRNSLVPVVTVIGAGFVVSLSVVVVVETVFSVRGIGFMLVDAISHQDIPVIQGMALFFALAAVIVNLATDLLYLALDPRIRHGQFG